MSRDPAVEAALAYEALHVPALFGEWADPLLDAAGVEAGDHVLDVACGTGAIARRAASRVGPDGRVTGLDLGSGMLEVAGRLEPRVEWVEADATDLPFDDDRFDAVVCSFGLMFFSDSQRAIAEMIRCVRPGGRVAVAVWDSLERSEAYPTTVSLLEEMAGRDAADALRAPFALGDTGQLSRLFDDAGATAVAVTTRVGTARFPSVRTMVEADLRGWLPIMGVKLSDSLIESILEAAEIALAEHVTDDGQMVFEAPGHIVTAQAD